MNIEGKPPAFDFKKVRKCIRFCRRYEEDIYVVPFWIIANGEEADSGEGEPAGLRVKEQKRRYYVASRWPNRNGTDDDAILPLALKSYYDGKMYTDNEWDTDDEEGVEQLFYKKENTVDEYEYATTWTMKNDEEVGPGEVVIPYRGKVTQDETMLDWSTKIHVPFENHYETWINLETATFDPFAPNARNKDRNLYVRTEEKKMRFKKFRKKDDSTSRTKVSRTYTVSIPPVTPPTATKKEKKEEKEEEEELIQSYINESEEEATIHHSEKDMETMEKDMFCADCGANPCIWEQYECAILEYADSYLPTYQPWLPRERLSYSRKCLYRKAAREIFGILRYAERKKFARCVVRGVRSIYPDPEGRYMGHQEHI